MSEMSSAAAGADALAVARGLKTGYADPIACPDFEIFPGDYLCITGPNGSGKTTLLKTLAGALEPLGGELRFGGGLRTGVGRRERGCASIGYLPQQGPVHKDFPASVREVVRSGCQALRGWRPFYSFYERRLAERAMARMGISGLASRGYRELSGGQRQRVLIARALVAPHRLLLLDEPASGLDPEAADSLMRMLAELNGKGVAIAMVTHDSDVVAAAAKSVLRLGPGASFERRRAG